MIELTGWTCWEDEYPGTLSLLQSGCDLTSETYSGYVLVTYRDSEFFLTGETGWELYSIHVVGAL